MAQLDLQSSAKQAYITHGMVKRDSPDGRDSAQSLNLADITDPACKVSSSDILISASEYRPGSEAEKRLLRKLDLRIIPCVWLLYITSYIDRANIGNAKTGGLEKDFNLTSNQYSLILLLFFVTYVTFEIPSNLIIARVRPSLYLSGLAVLWGIVAACMGATQNWQQLAGIRLVLGVVECGLAPGIAFYFSSWYKRYEVAKRFAIYYTAVALAGGLSGLLAGLITQYLDGARGIAGWRWLFIIEGAGSSFVGLIIWMIMPDFPSTTTWLTPEEQLLASQRLAYDGLAYAQGAHGRVGELDALRMALRDWRVWLLALTYMLLTGAQTMQYFIPTLVVSFGWSGWNGQYHTIPPYACAMVFILAFGFFADYTKNRSLAIALFSGIGTAFFVVVCASENHIIQYIFTTLAFGCVYGCSPLILFWTAHVITAPAEKRAIAIALVNSLGNAASIYGAFLFPSADAPRYVAGFSVTTASMGFTCLTAILAGHLFRKYPLEAPDADEVVRAEVKRLRQKNSQHGMA